MSDGGIAWPGEALLVRRGLTDMSLSHSDCHRLFAERPAKLPELQGPVLATRKLRPRSAVIATLRTDDLPVLGHGFYPSVWKHGVLVNREAPHHRVVPLSLAHAHSLSRRVLERTSQDAEQTPRDFKSDRGRNFGPAPAVSAATDQAEQDDQDEHGSNDDRKPFDAVALCFTDACAVRVGSAGGRRDHAARHHWLFATDIVVREIDVLDTRKILPDPGVPSGRSGAERSGVGPTTGRARERGNGKSRHAWRTTQCPVVRMTRAGAQNGEETATASRVYSCWRLALPETLASLESWRSPAAWPLR